ncbi:MAG: class I SAM-dependent methyltransferase [Bacteroidota bacterium]
MRVLEKLVEKISSLDAKHAKKLKKELADRDAEYFAHADRFYDAFLEFWEKEQISMEHVAGCYVRMREDMNELYKEFVKTESYPNTSFEAVNEAIYNQPEIMDYHMHGLTLAQFLWPDQYERFHFFSRFLESQKPEIKKYLEVGAGHGLYLLEAVRIIGKRSIYDVVDISPTSIEMSKNLISREGINFYLKNIFDMDPSDQYDLITMGELIEHLEDPLAMLIKARDLLTESGLIYMTTPANAPMIDHIYLFRNADEIRDLIRQAGLEIVEETHMYTDNMSKEVAERFKLPMMYAAFLRKA